LLDPFERIRSLWLARQCIVTQADDGTVAARRTIDEQPAVVQALHAALDDIRDDPSRDLGGRLGSVHRATSVKVRKKLREQCR
jgi:hypothetical protein